MSHRRRYRLDIDELDAQIDSLVAEVGADPDVRSLIEETVVAALKMGSDGVDRWDAKIARTALKEMRHAFRVFHEHRGRPKVTIFGSARQKPGSPHYEMARRFAQKATRHGYMVMTGAGPGIMEAGNKGAGRENSFGLGVQLPFEQSANEAIAGDPKFISFRFFFTRKLFFVKEAQAVVLCPGGFGTMDEAFETLTLVQTGRSPLIPIVMMDRPGGDYWSTWRYGLVDQLIADGMISPDDVHLFRVVEHEDDAIEAIDHFYRVFHSQREVGDDLVLRLKRPISEDDVARLNTEFSDVLREGGGPIRLSDALPEEENEPELAHLSRVIVPFKHRGFGRLRRLIDAINGTIAWEPGPGPARGALG